MEPFDVDDALAGADLVSVIQGTIPDVKRLVARCLDEDIPARAGRDHSCATGGCSPKAVLMVRREDAPRVAAMLQADWLDAARAEGTLDPEFLAKLRAAHDGGGDDPPCPACGHVGPLADGACADCGLQLG